MVCLVEMSPSDSSILNGETALESFWEIELSLLIRERSEIEAAYAKSLQQWSKKWSEHVDKGVEYGSAQEAWKAILQEGRSKADLHLQRRDRLIDEVFNVIKIWSKDNFHKTAFGAVKEGKEIEEAFKRVSLLNSDKISYMYRFFYSIFAFPCSARSYCNAMDNQDLTAQKPWAKLYGKILKAKREYFSSSRMERSAENQEKNAAGNPEMSREQVKKFHEKMVKCQTERQKAEEEYRKTVAAISDYKSTYQADMMQVFKRCQELELKRLKFFKEMLKGAHDCLNMSNEPKLNSIYEQFLSTVTSVDAEKDVQNWEKEFGPGMPFNCPVFETYTPEVREIVKKRNKVAGDEPVVLLSKRESIADPNADNCFVEPLDDKSKMTNSSDVTTHCIDEWDESGSSNEFEPKMVKALYDYNKQEDDEFSFKKGDIFEKLGDEDEQGWCKGRKDGITGLYPANYAVDLKA
ncbi:Protein kinase C and casein kinase substrate in neurons protein [Trichinella spiralis]|uniref:Protein kinase C and casein kinase substrate in neurons protein n=1 Tax=Trichinella spiralis TaxID=6334 RepID=A0ABR3KB48_TRISP